MREICLTIRLTFLFEKLYRDSCLVSEIYTQLQKYGNDEPKLTSVNASEVPVSVNSLLSLPPTPIRSYYVLSPYKNMRIGRTTVYNL